jgi:hypothetical protein
MIAPGLKNWIERTRQMGRSRGDGTDACRLKLRQTEPCHGVAAVMLTLASGGMKLRAVRALVVHRLAHAAGMRGGGGNRQGCGGETAHEHENQ